jgi:hypothetical protein
MSPNREEEAEALKLTTGAPNAPGLLVSIAIALVGSIVQPLVQGSYLTWRVIVTATVAVLLLILAYRWRRLKVEPGALQRSAELVASDFRAWLALVTIVWASNVIFSALGEVRLNNEIVALRNDTQSIGQVIERLVLPRHLTRNQQSVLANFLRGFDPHEFAFRLPKSDQEASQFASDIEQGLIRGGWTRSKSLPYEYLDNLPEGLSVDFIQTPEHAKKEEDPKNPAQDKLFQMALGLAGIRLNQMGGGGSRAGMTEDLLIIGVGRRRKDSYQLIIPDFAQ